MGKNKSQLEEHFKMQFEARNLERGMQREYKFHPTRKWRFDFAWPEHMVAVEIEGGAFTGGGHTRGAGFTANCEKYNSAAVRGWWVLRGTAPMIRDCALVEDLEAALGFANTRHPEVAEVIT